MRSRSRTPPPPTPETGPNVAIRIPNTTATVLSVSHDTLARMSDQKADLHRYLKRGREALLWKLDGLSEYDIRRPMTPTGTNLLGLVKHVASVECGYLGETFGRPLDLAVPWLDEGAAADADMWATAQESRDYIEDFYRQVWAHSDVTIETLDLETVGRVPWWSAEHAEVTLHRIIVHIIDETARHAGHADIVRELIDGAVGLANGRDNMGDQDAAWWPDYRARLESVAQQFR
jgi:uncharacterized damage-inducible protein DinB